MNIFRWSNSRLEDRARMHASEGNEALVDQEILVALGPRPAWEPVQNLEHSRVAYDLNNSAEIEELQGDLRQHEDELSRHPDPRLLLLFLVFLFGVEWVGATMLIRTLGVENPERGVLGAMLATFAFFITYITMRMAGLDSQERTASRRSPWFFLMLAVYAAFVFSVAVLRVDEASTDETASRAAEFATGMLMLFVTVGPAAVAEVVMRRRTPAVLHAKEIPKLNRRIRRRELAHEHARAYVEGLARRQETWDKEAHQLRALYEREFKFTQNSAAKRNGRFQALSPSEEGLNSKETTNRRRVM